MHSLSQDEFLSWVAHESNSGNNLQQYSVVSSPGSVHSRGVAILFRPIYKLDSDYSDDAGHLQVVNFFLLTSDSSSFQ